MHSGGRAAIPPPTGGNCVEVASLAGAVAVRDSKNPDGGTLVLSPAAWRTLIANVKAS